MAIYSRSWVVLPGVFAVALAAGYTLPRPGEAGDLMDAVAAVQRRAPRFLISEPTPPANWVRSGALYLCRAPRTVAEVDGLSKAPGEPDPRWAGVVCFKGTTDPNRPYTSGVDGGPRCLEYGAFAVFGDPELLEEVRAVLAAEGFRPTHGL
jgi:hypothetical protein